MASYGDYIGGADQHIADDFAGLDSPKLKFNFTMSLEYVGMNAEQGNDAPYEITFGIKQITRPAPNVIYEDVNYYNFMTKVATKVDFGVVTVTVYDDRNNRAHGIFKNYMEAISPITKRTRDQATLLDKYGQSDASLLGPLPSGARHGVIKNLRVNHIIDWTGKTVIYDFLNPKIQNVTLDELDMTASDVNTITFTFLYDTYHVETVDGSGATAFEELVGPPKFGGGDRDGGTVAANTNLGSDPMEGLDFINVTAERRATGAAGGAIPGPIGSTVGAQIAATLKTEATRYVAGVIAQQNIPNVPAIANALRNQSYVDGIPSQVLSNVLRRMTGGGGG